MFKWRDSIGVVRVQLRLVSRSILSLRPTRWRERPYASGRTADFVAVLPSHTETHVGDGNDDCASSPDSSRAVFCRAQPDFKSTDCYGDGTGRFSPRVCVGGTPSSVPARADLVRANVEICRSLWAGRRSLTRTVPTVLAMSSCGRAQ